MSNIIDFETAKVNFESRSFKKEKKAHESLLSMNLAANALHDHRINIETEYQKMCAATSSLLNHIGTMEVLLRSYAKEYKEIL